MVLARHIILNKQVAVKKMTLSSIKDSYVRKNLWREVSIMARLNHPNVVSLFEVCSFGDFFCLVMDLYPGGSLCDFVQDHPQGHLDEVQAKSFMKQLVSGLSYIHSKGIIHRDIKLDNVFLSQDKTVVSIGDFGLSNFWSPVSNLQTRCGSAEYAAPELFNKEESYDLAIDVWSLGVLLYTMLCGQFPFQVKGGHNDLKELINVIRNGLTEKHIKYLSHLSPECKLLLSQLLMVERSSRISLEEVNYHSWFFGVDELKKERASVVQLSLENQMMVAKKVKEKLKLNHLSEEKILSYVMSRKGRFGKTAGCFNLLAKEMIKKINEEEGFEI